MFLEYKSTHEIYATRKNRNVSTGYIVTEYASKLTKLESDWIRIRNTYVISLNVELKDSTTVATYHPLVSTYPASGEVVLAVESKVQVIIED